MRRTPIAMIIVGLFVEGIAYFWCLSSWRSQGTGGGRGMIVPASAAPHGSRPPHHPDLP
jgi:hypothetical protein